MPRRFLTAMVALAITAPASAGTWADSFFDSRATISGSSPAGPRSPIRSGSRTNRLSLCTFPASASRAVARLHGDGQRSRTGQSTTIAVNMDTQRFVGQKTVTIYVQFDRPQWDEVATRR